MQRLEVSGAVRPVYGSLGVKRLTFNKTEQQHNRPNCLNTAKENCDKYWGRTLWTAAARWFYFLNSSKASKYNVLPSNNTTVRHGWGRTWYDAPTAGLAWGLRGLPLICRLVQHTGTWTRDASASHLQPRCPDNTSAGAKLWHPYRRYKSHGPSPVT